MIDFNKVDFVGEIKEHFPDVSDYISDDDLNIIYIQTVIEKRTNIKKQLHMSDSIPNEVA